MTFNTPCWSNTGLIGRIVLSLGSCFPACRDWISGPYISFWISLTMNCSVSEDKAQISSFRSPPCRFFLILRFRRQMTNTSTSHSENFKKTSEIDDSCGLAVVFRVLISGLISLSSPALMRSNVFRWAEVLSWGNLVPLAKGYSVVLLVLDL